MANKVQDSFIDDLSLEIVLQEQFQGFEDRINQRISQSLRQGFKLIAEKLNGMVDRKIDQILDFEISKQVRQHIRDHEQRCHGQSEANDRVSGSLKKGSEVTLDCSLDFKNLFKI